MVRSMSLTLVKAALRSGIGKLAPIMFRARPNGSLVIVAYHRVLPFDHPDRLLEQAGMYVSPSTFQSHLNTMRQHFEIVHLSDWIDLAIAGKPLPSRACAITFDDGWKDNFDYAFPLIKQASAPATIFLVTDYVGSTYQFWPNRIMRLLSNMSIDETQELPEQLRLLIASAHGGSRTESKLTYQNIETVIATCKTRMTDMGVDKLLDGAFAKSPPTNSRTLLNGHEINEMARSGLVRFGSHGRRHYRLTARLNQAQLEDEIVRSRHALRELTGQPADMFCYPNGDYTSAAVEIVKVSYKCAVTTKPGWVEKSSDLHLMPRISVHDDITNRPELFLARLTGFV